MLPHPRILLFCLTFKFSTADDHLDHLPFGAPPQGAIRLRHELHTLKDFHFAGKITVQIFGAQRWLLESTALIRELWAELHG